MQITVLVENQPLEGFRAALDRAGLGIDLAGQIRHQGGQLPGAFFPDIVFVDNIINIKAQAFEIPANIAAIFFNVSNFREKLLKGHC